MKILNTLAVLCVLALAAPSLEATPLPVGGSVVPEALPDPGNVPLLGLVSGRFDFGSGPGRITGTYEQGVLVDPFGLTCPGCLDFFADVTLDGGLQAGIGAILMGLFGGFTTNVGYVDEISPILASRLTPEGGDVAVLFRFNVPGGVSHIIGPGHSSAALVVATNATHFDRHGGLLIAGGHDVENRVIGQIDGLFGPVPEPVTWSLLGIGLAGLGFSRRKCKQ